MHDSTHTHTHKSLTKRKSLLQTGLSRRETKFFFLKCFSSRFKEFIKSLKKQNNSLIILFSVLVSFFFVSLITYGVTTIGDNINTGGTLTVSGASNLIGSISASSTLQSTGAARFYSTARIDGATTLNGVAYTWPSSDGSSSQRLQTNGAGTLSWATVSSSDWLKQTNFGVLNLTASTTIPYWAKDAIYASSTLQVQGLTTLANATTSLLTVSNGAWFTTSLILPNGTSPTVDTLGQIALDTTKDQLLYYSGGRINVLQATSSFSFLVPSPSGFSGKDYPLKKLNNNITISKINCITDPTDTTGVQMQIDLYESNSTGDATSTVDAIITCDNDGATDDNSLTNPTIDLNDWLGVHFYTASGTPQSVTVDVQYTIDRQ